VACDKAGKYISVVRARTDDSLVLAGVAVFIDCDSPLLPWDSIDEFPLTLEFGKTKTASIPLATNLENALGVNVCGQLEVQFDNLPSFCSLTGADL